MAKNKNLPPSLDSLGPAKPRGNLQSLSERSAGHPGGVVSAPPKPAPPPSAPEPKHAPGHYLLHATAPLVFGTGRPLGFGLGGSSLSFPFPSTVAGALRAAVESAHGLPPNPFAGRENVVLNAVGLVRLSGSGQGLFASPADALFAAGQRWQLVPKPLEPEAYTDLEPGLEALQLASEATKAKPDKTPPWWTAEELFRWLSEPHRPDPAFKGDEGPKTDVRTHVVIDHRAKGAIQGGLYRSAGVEFRGLPGYALSVACNQPGLAGAARRVGGEGRFARWEDSAAFSLPPMPEPLRLALTAQVMSAGQAVRRVRCVLTTPAVFESQGWCPDGIRLNEDRSAWVGKLPGQLASLGQVTLAAAAITRAQSYARWASEGDSAVGPGRSWRVVPAGSVFWIELPAHADATSLWGASLCEPAWANDGWGRCLVGVA